MGKRVFIINGSGGVGKDTLVNEYAMRFESPDAVQNWSSIDLYRFIAQEYYGMRGKDDKDRRLLADLKRLAVEYGDIPKENALRRIDEFYKNAEEQVLFMHIREPEEIRKVVNESPVPIKTILVTRSGVPVPDTNADKNVWFYPYNITIDLDDGIENAIDIIEEAFK